jgi:AraC family transcriptional regulator of adaptative response/methylated-DNA-[protein]-cysteine methyltransferase
VAFHESCEDAEKAGFRACKRCKPNVVREEIRFATGRSMLGLVLTAVSDRGLCAILIGDDAAELERDLKARFPGAKLAPGQFVEEVARLMEAPAERVELPLDTRGTSFQRRVWQALLEIPAGKTASYREIADRIGSPKSVRAVAQACGANHLAVVIPCHRVVRSDGDISGYRWGVERKQALLAREVSV